MKEIFQKHGQSILGTGAAVAIVFGISVLLFSGGDVETIPDPDPEVIERQTFEVPERPDNAPASPDDPVIISPATISVQNASPGLQLPPLRVQNQSSESRKLFIDFAPIYRSDSQGVPVILSDAANIERGSRLVGLRPSGEVAVGPEETLEIQPTLLRTPPDPTLVGSIGVTLIGKRGKLSAPEKGGVQTRVQQNVRLSALLYAVFPGGTSDRVLLDNLRVDPLGGAGRLRVVAEIDSQGDLPAEVSGSVLLRGESGQVLSRPLPATTVLPGQRSTTSSLPFQGVQPGRYRVEARIRQGVRGQSLSRSLLVDSQGFPAVAEADARLLLDRPRVLPGQSVNLDFQMRNTGEKRFQPEVTISLYPYSSERAISSRELPLETLAPGSTASRELRLRSPQKPGEYVYVATVRNESGELLEESTAGLSIGSDESKDIPLDARVRDWLSDNPGAGVAAGAVLTGLVLLLLLLFWRIRDRRKG